VKSYEVLKVLEPCQDCNVPMNVMITDMTKKTDERMRYVIECRDCKDKWIEEVEK
jgi:DNA-directed RNA polymerase subunit M/transcription elongation factor TFIIS